MSAILPFTKESVTEAIKSIEINPGLRQNRESAEYNLIYENEKYPPILVLSQANQILGGTKLTIEDFGNSAKKAFKILTDLGFSIIPKDTSKDSSKKVWFVAQGGTFEPGKGMNYLWAPQKDKNGKPRFYWENVLKV